MRDIYVKATEVVVFLGDGRSHRIIGRSWDRPPPFDAVFHNSSLDNELIANFIRRWIVDDVPPKVSSLDVFSFIAMRVRGQDEVFCGEANRRGRDLTGLFEALHMMLLSAWWSRMWVFQEAILARTLTVRYGGVACPWSMFEDAAQNPSASSSSIPSVSRKVLEYFSKLVQDIARNRRSINEEASSNQQTAALMLNLLRTTGARKASDDRDKVFALLGLVSMETMFLPSYTMTTENVYTAIVSQIIAHGRSLAPLYGDLGRKNRKNLPSWVPDWSAIADGREISRTAHADLYNACGDGDVEYVASLSALRSYALRCLERFWTAKFDNPLLLSEATRFSKTVNRVKPSQEALGEGENLAEEIPAPLWMAETGIIDGELHLLGRYVAPVTRIGEAIVSEITSSDIGILYGSFLELTYEASAHANPLQAFVSYLKLKDNITQRLSEEDDEVLERWFAKQFSRLDFPPIEVGLMPQEDREELKQWMDWQFDRLDFPLSGAGLTARKDREDLKRWMGRQKTRLDSPPSGADVMSRKDYENLKRLMKREMYRIHLQIDNVCSTGSNDPDELGFDEILKHMASGRRLFVAGGRLGWGPLDTKPGDRVYILPGGKVPFVLRKQTTNWNDNKYRLVGDCLLQGVMDGEMCRDEKWEAVLLPVISWMGLGCNWYTEEGKGKEGDSCALDSERHFVHPFTFTQKLMEEKATLRTHFLTLI